MFAGLVRSGRGRGWVVGGLVALALATGAGPAAAQTASAAGPAPRLVVVEDFTDFA